MEIKSIKRIGFSVLATLVLTSCNCNKKVTETNDNDVKVDETKYIGYTKVNLVKNELDGCLWIFELEEVDEETGLIHLMPVENFPEASAVEGKYYLKYTLVDVMTTCMMGKPIQVDEMLPRK